MIIHPLNFGPHKMGRWNCGDFSVHCIPLRTFIFITLQLCIIHRAETRWRKDTTTTVHFHFKRVLTQKWNLTTCSKRLNVQIYYFNLPYSGTSQFYIIYKKKKFLKKVSNIINILL